MKILIHTYNKDGFLEPIFYSGLTKKYGSKSLYLYKSENNKIDLDDNTIKNNIISDLVIDDFDYIFFFDSSILDNNIKKIVNKKNSTVKIWVDGLDDFFIRGLYNNPEIKFYLKREVYKIKPNIKQKLEWQIRYLYEYGRSKTAKYNYKNYFSYFNVPIKTSTQNLKKVLPFQLSVDNQEAFQGRYKDQYDISFLGHANNPERNYYLKKITSWLKTTKLKHYISTEIVKKNAYINLLKKSKVNLSLRGVGYDTFRYWEIPCSGSTLLSQKLPIAIPNDFVDEESALYFDNFEEMKHKIEKYIINSYEYIEIAKNGKKHFFKYHTPEKRITWLMDHLK